MKNEALKTIEKIEEISNFLEEDGEITIDNLIKICDHLEIIKNIINQKKDAPRQSRALK